MPYRDGTGPLGQGSRTGHGAGNCAGAGGVGRIGGRGFNRRGTGRGFSRGLEMAPEQDRSWVENQIQSLRSALKSISDQLDELKKD